MINTNRQTKEKKKDLILICARKGSKGIINKNLKKIGKNSTFFTFRKITKFKKK